ncbi:hypothetical protein D9758_015606 [Tetrapyrgos nigripes]|uniref:Uncharacterized protein n=1 Tax=Tetrapyrgos nigripes TaxID=182062 RepID=A0A8H5CDS5_9AGAR|nr:hypothetical protein D9758_015606 [Tetrapyrgos nigripes]
MNRISTVDSSLTATISLSIFPFSETHYRHTLHTQPFWPLLLLYLCNSYPYTITDLYPLPLSPTFTALFVPKRSYGINKLWRTALLTASRNLRQNVLRGRIWGFEDESNPGIGGLEEMAADDEEQDDESTPNKNTVNTGSTRRPLPTPGSSPSVSANTSPNALAVPMQTGSAASSRNNTMSKSGNRHAFVTGTNPSNAGSVRVRGVSGLLDDFSESQFNGGEKAINLLGEDEDEDGDTHARMGTVVSDSNTLVYPLIIPISQMVYLRSERSSSPENANAMDGRQSSPSSPAVLTKKNRGGKSLRVKAKAGKARPSSDMMLGMQVEEGGGRKGTKGRVSLSRMMAGGLDRRASLSPTPSPTKEHGSFTFTNMSQNSSNGRVKGMAEILEDMKALREIGRVRERSGSTSSVSSTHSRSNSFLGTTSGEEEEPRSAGEGGFGSGQSSPGKRPLPVPPYEYDIATAKLAKPTLPIPTLAAATTTTLPTPPPTAGEEPTIEELLAKQDAEGHSGQYDDVGLTDTMKYLGRNRVKSKARAVDDDEAYYSPSSSRPGVGVYAWEAEVEDDQGESPLWEGKDEYRLGALGRESRVLKLNLGRRTGHGQEAQTQSDLDNDEDSTIAALTQSINQTKNMLAKLGDRLQEVEKKVEEEEKELEQAVKKRNETQSTTPAKGSFVQRFLYSVLGRIVPSTSPLSSFFSVPTSSSTASTPPQPQPQTPTTRQTPESLIQRLLISTTHLPARYHAHLARLLDPQTFSFSAVAPYVVLMSLGMWIVVWRLFGVGWEGLGRNVWRKVGGVGGGVPIPFK